MVPGKFATNHFICTGEDPSNYQFLKSKVSISSRSVKVATQTLGGGAMQLVMRRGLAGSHTVAQPPRAIQFGMSVKGLI